MDLKKSFFYLLKRLFHFKTHEIKDCKKTKDTVQLNVCSLSQPINKALEKKVKNKHIFAKKSFEQIQKEWEQIQGLDSRTKAKAMRSIAHDISVSYNKKKTPAKQIEFYMNILRQVTQSYTYPETASRLLSKLTTDWLELTYKGKMEIILEKTGVIPVDVAMIFIADPGFNIDKLENIYCGENLLPLINQGKCYVLYTDADAAYRIRLRVIDYVEPILTGKEYAYIRYSTQTTIIQIPTGIIAVGGNFSFFANETVSATVTPGNYKICAYASNKNYDSFTIVLCKTNTQITKNS